MSEEESKSVKCECKEPEKEKQLEKEKKLKGEFRKLFEKYNSPVMNEIESEQFRSEAREILKKY